MNKYIYIYIFRRRMEGVIPVSSISSFIGWVRRRGTRRGTDLGYACRVEEEEEEKKKKYLLDGPRIEFLRRLEVLPYVGGKRRGLTNRE